MDINHLKAELQHHKMEWNALGNHFDKTEEKILDCLRTGEKEGSLKHYEALRRIEGEMRPLRNSLVFICENLAQFSSASGNCYEENDFYQKARNFQKSRFSRSERSLKITGLLNRNGIIV